MFSRIRSAFTRALMRFGILASDEESEMYARIDARLDELAALSRARGVTTLGDLDRATREDRP